MLMVSHPFFADFDGDNFVGSSDIEHAVKLLTQNELAMDEIESIWEKVRSGEIDSIEVTRGRKDLQKQFTRPFDPKCDIYMKCVLRRILPQSVLSYGVRIWQREGGKLAPAAHLS